MIQNHSLLFKIAIASILALALILTVFCENKNFEELGLGENTISSTGKIDGFPIHIIHNDSLNEIQFLDGWQKRGKKDCLLILGNSQTHGLNHPSPGQNTYPALLNKKLDTTGDVMAVSIPNASLQELYVIASYWLTKLPVRTITLPVFMDDLRENGLRDVYLSHIIEQKFQIPDSTDEISKKLNHEILEMNKNLEKTNGLANDTHIQKTPQDKSEAFLNKFLDNNFKPWAYRPNMRGDFFNKLYLMRNSLLGINANTIRKMIPAHTEKNLAAFDALIKLCKLKDIKLLVYIPPIRSDVPIPYAQDEYKLFKDRVKQMTETASQNFVNLENIVPGKFWGFKAATNLNGKPEIDFMHFRYEGHQILADSLYNQIIKLK